MANIYFDSQKTKGRPRMILNEEGANAIEKLASMMCTDEEIASVLKCTVDTLQSKWNKKTFMERKARGRSNGKASLRRMQFKAAEGGNATMLIWLGKQFLDQTEKQETTIKDANVSFEITPASRRDE